MPADLYATGTTTWDACASHRTRAAGTGNATGKITFTVYDDYGRVTRVGEAEATFSDLDRERTYPFERDNVSWRSRMTYDDGDAAGDDAAGGDAVAGGGPNYVQGRLAKFEESTDTGAPAEVAHAYAYDHLGNVRVKQVTIGGLTGEKTLTYVHDLAGRVTRLTYPDGAQARYAYDSAGRLSRVWDAHGRTLASYTHTAAGNIATHTVGHVAGDGMSDRAGGASGDGIVTGAYTYNARDWVTGLDYAGAFRSTLTYDPVGNVTRQVYRRGSAASKSEDYAYDDLYRITGFDLAGGDSRDYAYDKNGNITSLVTGTKTLTYNYSDASTPNRLDSTTGAGGQTYAYNQNGWMTRRGTDTVSYDYRGLTTGYGNARYLMDPDRRRVKKTVGAAVTYYLRGADGAVLAEYSDQNLLARYVYAGSRRIARVASSGNRYYLADHLGSTRALVDEEGAVTATYDYWPFGDILASSGTGSTHFRFTGHERDSEAGLDYMLERSYAFDIGRFLRPDPMADEYPGISPYAYANNNPLKYVDPDGSVAVFGAIFGAAIDVGVQIAIDGRSLNEIDLVSVGISAAAGATGVGLVSSVSKLSRVARLGVEVTTDVGFSTVHQLNESGKVSSVDTAIDVVSGNVVGRLVGRAIGGIAHNSGFVKSSIREANRLNRIGDNAAGGGRTSRAISRYRRADALDKQVEGYVQRRATSASTAASQASSKGLNAMHDYITDSDEEENND